MKKLVLITLVAVLAGCSEDFSDLEQYIAEVKARPGGRIEPLPQIKPYQTFVYSASDLRSPFQPATEQQMGPQPGTATINVNRPREFLEQYPLDSLRMVGTLNIGGTRYALIKTADELINRVRVGNFMGQSEGQIVEITDSEIKLIEIVSDGIGGYIERPAAVPLSD
ncbi:MAG: pilus assembly protein PilP [Gammaproteobacteria bacterium]|nr:pilus assembly protein PilP [Gammaproteobacteria bacterium]